MSCDPAAPQEMAAMLGASLALCISNIPFDGPIAGVVVGRINGQMIIDPSVEEKALSDINLTVAGTKDAIMMVEAGAAEVPEEEMLDAIMFGHEAIKKLCAFQEEIIKAVGKPKRHIDLYAPDETIKNDIYSRINDRMVDAIDHTMDKLERQDKIDALKNEILDDYDAREYANEKSMLKPCLWSKIFSKEWSQKKFVVLSLKIRLDQMAVKSMRSVH